MDGSSDGSSLGSVDGSSDGSSLGSVDGSSDGSSLGSVDGSSDGSSVGSSPGSKIVQLSSAQSLYSPFPKYSILYIALVRVANSPEMSSDSKILKILPP